MSEYEKSEVPTSRRMKLRYAGTCRLCGTDLPARAEAIYERGRKTVRCVACPPAKSGGGGPPATQQASSEPPVVDAGVAGSSARREYERRTAKDEERLRQKWGKFGGIAVALSEEKQSTKAWATGAVGEERLGARLDSLASDSIAVLHDRRIPGTRANIDHIAITRAGIWVIDAKRYEGRPELKIEGSLLRPRIERVLVGGRDCTKLVDWTCHYPQTSTGVYSPSSPSSRNSEPMPSPDSRAARDESAEKRARRRDDMGRRPIRPPRRRHTAG